MLLMALLPLSILILFFMAAIRHLPSKITIVLIKSSKVKIIEVESFMKKERSKVEICVQTILESDQQKQYLVNVSTGSNHDKKLAGMKEKMHLMYSRLQNVMIIHFTSLIFQEIYIASGRFQKFQYLLSALS